MFCEHDVNAMIATLELIGQDLAAKQSTTATVEARNRVTTAGRYACRDRRAATCARIDHTPCDLHWWRWRWRAANWGWGRGTAWITAIACLCRHSQGAHESGDHATGN